MPSPFRSLIGRKVDRYEIESQLGQGGFGVVYLARHTVLGTKVALKVLWPDHADDPKSVRRFLREARAAAAAGSEHIVRVLDAGVSDDDYVFLAMEVLEGHDLDAELDERGPLPIGDAIAIARQVLEGLTVAHAAGVVHRDLKPANVFVVHTEDGSPKIKLLDFGISKVLGSKSLTTGGGIIGTPQYMAPEQIDARTTVDPRADLFSVGVLLFEMLSQEVPFEGTGYEVLVERVKGRKPPPLRSVAEHVPEPIAAVVDCAMATDRNARWQTAQAMLDALAEAEAGRMPTPPDPSVFAPEPTVPDAPRSVSRADTLPAKTQPIRSERPPPAKTQLLPSERPPPARTQLLPSERPAPAASDAARPSRLEARSALPRPRGEARPSGRPPSERPSAARRPSERPSAPSSGVPGSRAAAGPVPVPRSTGPSEPPRVARTLGWLAIAGLAMVTALGVGVLAALLYQLAEREPDEPSEPAVLTRPSQPSPSSSPSPSPSPSPEAVVPVPVAPEPVAEPEPLPTPVVPVPAPGAPLQDAPPDPSAVTYQVRSHVGVGSERAMEEVYERARRDVASCGEAQRLHVSVQLIATEGGRISIAQPSTLRPSDDVAVARCVAGAIADNGPADFTASQTAIVELDVDVPSRGGR